LPATVLTQARISHALVSAAREIAAAEAATRAPSNRTEPKRDVVCQLGSMWCME
jgi:hypothetical protein